MLYGYGCFSKEADPRNWPDTNNMGTLCWAGCHSICDCISKNFKCVEDELSASSNCSIHFSNDCNVPFFLSISKIGLAQATAIMDINPVLITLGAFLFLGEKIGPRRIFGVFASLIGAMIIIRPGSEVFTVYAVLPLFAAICYSAYNLTTRFVGKNENPWTSLLYTALCGATVFTAIVPFYWQPVSMFSGVLILLLAICGTALHLFLIRALAIGEASMLAPFVYVGLIFVTLWGILFFEEYPDQWTILGAFIIAVSGVYVWYRDTFGKLGPIKSDND